MAFREALDRTEGRTIPRLVLHKLVHENKKRSANLCKEGDYVRYNQIQASKVAVLGRREEAGARLSSHRSMRKKRLPE
jgi:hypothetical protein